MFISELHILTDDLKGSIAFYSQSLGFKILQLTDTQVTFLTGSSTLTFLSSEKKNNNYHFAFNIPWNKINEALTWISERAEPLILENDKIIADFHNWNAEAFYFLDNNGNILEFIGRRDLKNEIDEPFDADKIISISEAGIVTDNVSTECTGLINKYGLDYFDKQPPLEHFAALGDDNGLLIVVPSSRNWYPTNIPAAFHWLKAMIKINNNSFTIGRE